MKTELEFVRTQMSKYYNQKRLKGPTFAEGDMVYLSTKNITTKRPSKKLDNKFLGPYPIVKKISENNYQLELPSKVRIHPVFHISLLESAADTIKVHTEADDIEVEGEQEYEPERILDSSDGVWSQVEGLPGLREHLETSRTPHECPTTSEELPPATTEAPEVSAPQSKSSGDPRSGQLHKTKHS